MPSSIEWLWPPGFSGESWNPVTGCEKVSPGCAHCYAELFARRFPKSPSYSPNYLPGTALIVSHDKRLGIPFGWVKPRFVFVNSQSDLYHEQVRDSFLVRCYAVMSMTPQHTYLILTKRPKNVPTYIRGPGRNPGWLWGSVVQGEADRIRKMNPKLKLPKYDGTWPLPNVWLGVSAENQVFADERIPLLLNTPAAVRFVSYEPALKLVDFTTWLGGRCSFCTKLTDFCDCDWQGLAEEHGYFDDIPDADFLESPALDRAIDRFVGDNPDKAGVDWVIVGGESGGKRARICVGGIEEAMRSTLAQCQDAGVAYFGKQMGSPWAKANGDRGKGENMQLWPEDLRVREWPQAAMVLA